MIPEILRRRHTTLTFLLLFLFGALISNDLVVSQIPDAMPSECENVTVSEDDVGKIIFKEYSGSWQRPRLNARHPLILNISLSLSTISEVLEKDRIIKVTAYLALRWMDEFHVWNKTYPLYCVPYVVLQATDLWRPDIAQMNSPNKYALLDMAGEKIRLHSNGFTTFSPGGTFETMCDFDFTLFPFDTQRCSIQLESWRYTRDYVTFQLFNPHKGIRLYQWHENDQWELVGREQNLVDQAYTYKELIFDRVEFTLFLKRKSTYYLLNIIVPSLIISIAQVSSYAISSRDTIKMELSFTCLLAYSVFQLQIVENMPTSSDRLPYLSIYIALQMFYISLTMLGTGGTFLLLQQADDGFHDQVNRQVPPWLYKMFLFIGKILFVGGAPKIGNTLQEMMTNELIRRAAATTNETTAMMLTSSSPPSNEGGGGETAEAGSDGGGTTRRWGVQRQTASLRLVTSSQRSEDKRQRKARILIKRHWIYMAAVSDRANFAFYMLCIIVTPIIILIRAPYYQPWR